MSLFAVSRGEDQEALMRILCTYAAKPCGVNGAGNISEIIRELIKKKKLDFIATFFAHGMTMHCLKFDPFCESIRAKAFAIFRFLVPLATHDQLNNATAELIATKKWTDENLFMLMALADEVKKRNVMMFTYARDVCSFEEWIEESIFLAVEERNGAALDFLEFRAKKGSLFSPSAPYLAGIYDAAKIDAYFVANAQKGEPKKTQRGPGRKLRIVRRKAREEQHKRIPKHQKNHKK